MTLRIIAFILGSAGYAMVACENWRISVGILLLLIANDISDIVDKEN